MSCCGYQTLQWYYTYPQHPYKYVEVKQPAQKNVTNVTESYIASGETVPSPPQFWSDTGRRWA